MTLCGIPLRNTVGRQWYGEHDGIALSVETREGGTWTATLYLPSGRRVDAFGDAAEVVERSLMATLRNDARENTQVANTLDRLMPKKSAA